MLCIESDADSSGGFPHRPAHGGKVAGLHGDVVCLPLQFCLFFFPDVVLPDADAVRPVALQLQIYILYYIIYYYIKKIILHNLVLFYIS